MTPDDKPEDDIVLDSLLAANALASLRTAFSAIAAGRFPAHRYRAKLGQFIRWCAVHARHRVSLDDIALARRTLSSFASSRVDWATAFAPFAPCVEEEFAPRRDDLFRARFFPTTSLPLPPRVLFERLCRVLDDDDTLTNALLYAGAHRWSAGNRWRWPVTGVAPLEQFQRLFCAKFAETSPLGAHAHLVLARFDYRVGPMCVLEEQ